MELATQIGTNIEIIATVILGILIAVFNYKKTNPIITTVETDKDNSKLLKDITTAILDYTEEFTREYKKQNRLVVDLKDAIVDNTEKTIINTETMIKIMRRREINESS